MDGRLLAVALVVLAVASGCSMPVLRGGGDAATVTPAPAPSPLHERLAPGIAPDGLVIPRRLVAAHQRRLTNRTYTVLVDRTRFHSADVARRRSIRAAVDDANRRYRVETVTSNQTTPARRRIVVATPHQAVVLTTTGNESDRRRLTDDPLAAVRVNRTWSERLRGLLDGVRIDSITPRKPGARRYRLESEHVANASRFLGTRENLQSLSFNATVTADGLIESYTLSYSFVRGHTLVTIDEQFRIVDVGTTSVETALPNETRKKGT